MKPASGELQFRAAIDFDYASLADAFNRSFEGYAVSFQFDSRALEQRARPENWDLAASFLAYRDDVLAGVLFTSRRGRSCRVAAMGVTTGARRGGVGRAMMERAIAEARQRGDTEFLLEVMESNTPARQLYEAVGLLSRRRLVGFELANPPAGERASLTEIELGEFAALAHAEYEPHLPWQIQPGTLANLTLPARAFSLEGRAFALLSDPAAARVGLRGLLVRESDRRKQFGTRLLHALFAEFPGKVWAVSPIVPEGLADDFLLANGFAPAALSQHEMSMRLTPAA
jgi:GNAT superfamily N-acetyltransferase